MPAPYLRFLAAFLAIPSVALAQQLAPEAPPPSEKLALSTRAVDVAPDGSWTMTTHNEVLLLQSPPTAAPVRAPVGYDDASQQTEITEAYVRKPDGHTVPVPPEAIASVGANAGAAAARQKIISYFDAAAGDTLVSTVTVHARPLLEGSFFFTVLFPSQLAVERATVTFTVPKSLPVTAEVHGLALETRSQGDKTVYSIAYANPAPAAAGTQQVSEYDRGARLTISSFRDYDAFAKSYAALAMPMLAVTPAIQQQADQITGGVADRYQMARQLYSWVAGHLRYVAVDLGQGGLAPRAAGSLLSESAGDGRDHAVLFAALLKAKGIDASLVLVNATNSYGHATPPNLVPFNHMIVWLPEFKLYADASAGTGVPFGLLPRAEYGKTALHLGESGALRRVPLADGKTSSDSYRLVMRLDAFGHLESESSSTGTGDFAGPLRTLGMLIQGDNSKSFAASVLARTNVAGATGALIAPPPDPDVTEYKVAATYAMPQLGNMASGNRLKLLDDLQLLRPVSSNFYGGVLDERFKGADPVTCFSGHSSDDETLEFPATRHLEALPRDSSVTTQHVSYSAHWSQTPTSVTVHREFDAHFDQPLCTAWVRDEVLGVYTQVQQDIAGAIVSLPRN